jgi:hypothetical protein
MLESARPHSAPTAGAEMVVRGEDSANDLYGNARNSGRTPVADKLYVMMEQQPAKFEASAAHLMKQYMQELEGGGIGGQRRSKSHGHSRSGSGQERRRVQQADDSDVSFQSFASAHERDQYVRALEKSCGVRPVNVRPASAVVRRRQQRTIVPSASTRMLALAVEKDQRRPAGSAWRNL